jgi:hypothetical protein
MSRHRGIPFAIGLAITMSVYAPVSLAQVLPDQEESEVPDLNVEQITWITRLTEAMPMPRSLSGEAAALVMMPAVQEELELTDDQTAQLGQLVKAKMERIQEDIQTGRVAVLDQEYEAAVARVLKSRQRTRLMQIVLQKMGPRAITEPEVAAKLRLNFRQQLRIQMIPDQIQAAQSQAWAAYCERTQSSGSDMARAMADVVKLRQRANTLQDGVTLQMGRVLTRKQQDTFNHLLGEPFDFTHSRPRDKRNADTPLEPHGKPVVASGKVAAPGGMPRP